MSTYHPEPSTSSMSSSTRQRPPNRRSPSSYTTSSRPTASQHHRRASGSVLTIQTQLTNHYYPPGPQGAPENPSNPRFSYLLNTVLGSPFLTTTDIVQPPSHFSLDNNGGEERDRPRPPSPSPTADYSIIDTEELEADNPPIFRIPGGYPYPHQRSLSSSFANISLQSRSTWPHPRRRTYDAVSGFTGTSFLSLNHPTESISMPNMPQPSNPFKTLLPRILDAIASPSKAFSGNHNNNASPSSSSTSINSSPAGSPRTFPHSISLPTGLFGSQSSSGRQSPLLWSGQPRNSNSKGKGRAQSSYYFPFTSEPAEDLDYSELSPLDGEEGELIDEACFVDVRAVTGVDILALLPPELALYILQLICPTPVPRNRSHHARTAGLDPLSNEAEEQSKVALRAILACLAVSRTWRRLANDNSVWHTLFLGRWCIDLRKADASHMRKPGSGLSPALLDSPTRQQKRHRWKLKHKPQAFKFGASSKSNAPSPCVDPQAISSASLAPKTLCHPKQKFPLQFGWKRMYMERLQLEKRWAGTAFVRVSVSPAENPSAVRETGRSLERRGNPRSRSLSPTRFLGSGSNTPGSSASGSAADRSLAASTLGRAASRAARELDTRSIPTSRTEPSDMATLFKEQKWEPKTMELRGHSDSVYCVEFDSRRIITGSRDQTIMVWSLKTGKLLGTFVGAHTGSVLCLKFEKDWDLDLSNPSMTCQNDETSLSMDMGSGSDSTNDDLGYSGKKTGFMFTGSSDCTICVWKLGTGDLLDDGPEHVDVGREDDRDRQVLAEPIAILKGHTGGVLDLRIDRHWIVSCSKDTVIRVWDRKTLRLHRMLRGHEGPVNAVGLQNGRVVSASGDGKMILWDIETGERLKTFDGHDRGLACIEFKDDLIVSGSNDCKIRVWNAWTGECLRTLAGHNALVRAISFDPKTGRLLSASYDKVVKVWDLYNGKLIREFKYTHTSHIFDVKFDLGRVVSASHDRRICVLDFTAGINASVFI